MEYIPISEENYQILIANQGSFITLEEFIMAMFKAWQAHTYEENIEVIEELQDDIKDVVEKEKTKAVRSSRANNEGALWQMVASRFPEFPYGFFEYFELHSPSGKSPPIDAIAFPGLDDNAICSIDILDFQSKSSYVAPHRNGKINPKWMVQECVSMGNVNFKIICPKTINLKFPGKD
jgi:predicted Holliday junction resolvase-like endonuclease